MQYVKIDVSNEYSAKDAHLQGYFLDDSVEFLNGKRRPLVVICPGGAYRMTSDREAEPVAMKYLSEGYHVAILRYSVTPAEYPAALFELAKAVAYLKKNADKYHINSNHIFIEGFSAGGHLAASYGIYWNSPFLREWMQPEQADLRIKGLLLCYPVITSGRFANHESIHNLLGEKYEEKKEEVSLEKHVHDKMPPVFIWHTQTDKTVPVENAFLFVQTLIAHQVPVEFHMYPTGVHGVSLADELTQNSFGVGVEECCQSWYDLSAAWIKRNLV